MGLLNKILKNKKSEEATDEKAVEKTDKVKAETKKVEKKKTSQKIDLENRALDILLHPLVTEKSANAESMNKYSFIVVRNCNKDQIKKAVLDIYGIKPTRVQIMNYQGKVVRFKRSTGKRQDYKKAVVTLPKGKSIDIHKGV